jgi:hypothetical protein
LLEKLHDKENKNDEDGVYYCPTKCDYSWKSALAHSGIHLFANIGVLLNFFSYLNINN